MPNSTLEPIFAALRIHPSLPPAGFTPSPAPLSPLLPSGADPCVVLDSAGYVIAANDRAAQLMGQPTDALVGQFFGVWGPELDHADLDLIRIRHGVVESSSVRARRFSDGASASTSIVFEAAPPAGMRLSEAIGLTALEVQAPNLSLSFFQLPDDVRVGPEFREMVRSWVIFFRNAADSGDADLHIRAQKSEPEWLELEFYLHQPDPPPLRPGSYESTDLDEAAAIVEKLGGTFQIRVDYPEISARLRVPIV